jgi:DNA-binding transcriptional LysR family regulator
MEADTIDSILTMVASGYGISVVPEHSILPHHRKPIAQTTFGSPPVTRKLCLLLSKKGTMPIDKALHDGFAVAAARLKSPKSR